MRVILPSHRCFDDSIEFLEQAVKEHGVHWANERLRLVHGICLAPEGPHKGRPFSHGWVELDRRFVIQAGIVDGVKDYFVGRRREHYAELRVQVTTVYTVEEAWMKNRETNMFGPWEETYRMLCSTEHTVFQEAGSDGAEATVSDSV